MLFQDAVILGAANEPMPLECTSPAPTSLSPQAFPFCTLERTVSHIVIQFSRKMLKFDILLTDPLIPHNSFPIGFREFGDTSRQYSSVDDYRHSHHLFVWQCINIVKRLKILSCRVSTALTV